MEYSQNFKTVIETAKKYSGNVIEPNHLLLGLLLCDNSMGYKLLKNVIDVDDAKQRLLDMYKDNADDSDVNESSSSSRIIAKLTQTSENIVMQSQLEANKYKSTVVKTEHLVLSMTRARVIDTVSYESIEKIYLDMSDIEKPDESKSGTSKKQNQKSKTPILDEFSTDLTKLAAENKLDPVVGRLKELTRIAQVLSRRKKNNPILIGDPGVGKTAIVEGLAQNIINRTTPDVLYDKRILSIDLGSIVAGTKYRGEFEERMKKIVAELKKSDNIILYIDEIHTIVGAGGSSGSLDAANILKPALARGEISCIGATTNDEYKKIEKDGALDRRFQKIRISEPTEDETLEILRNLSERYEKFHTVRYSEDVLKACLKLSDRYITDRKFPDKAIDALDEVGSAVKIKLQSPSELVEMEKERDNIINQKFKMVEEQKFEEAAKLKEKQDVIIDEIEKIKDRIHQKRLKNLKEVTVEDVAEVISVMTGIPSENISEDDTESLVKLLPSLKELVIGQDTALDKITRAIFRNKAGLNDTQRPIGTFLFLGPTGVGKTYLAKMLAKLMFKDERNMIRIDMSEYMEKHTVSRLIGAPPGYVGHEDGGQLTDAVKKNPYSIILLDEVEKAHSDVWNILLQVFDDGILTDSQGRTVNFKNTVIIMTSNIGSKEAKASGGGIGFNIDKAVTSKSIVEKELKKRFTPEFLNRVDETVYFNPLSEDNIKSIIDIELNKFNKRLDESNITLELDETAKDFIFEMGWDEDMGARPLKRAIQKYIQDEISVMIITKEVESGDKLTAMKSLTEDKLEFIKKNKLLEIGSIEEKTSDIEKSED